MILLDIVSAAKAGDVKAVKHWLDSDRASVNTTDSDGATPLMFAAMRGHLV